LLPHGERGGVGREVSFFFYERERGRGFPAVEDKFTQIYRAS